MLQGYRLFDADAHAMMSPRMWGTLPKQYFARRPRPTHVADACDMGRWANGGVVQPPCGYAVVTSFAPPGVLEADGETSRPESSQNSAPPPRVTIFRSAA